MIDMGFLHGLFFLRCTYEHDDDDGDDDDSSSNPFIFRESSYGNALIKIM